MIKERVWGVWFTSFCSLFKINLTNLKRTKIAINAQKFGKPELEQTEDVLNSDKITETKWKKK